MISADEGIENLESLDVLKVRPLTQFGSPIEILREFGGKELFLAAVRELEGEIYRGQYRKGNHMSRPEKTLQVNR